jgi:hypothetical protein
LAGHVQHPPHASPAVAHDPAAGGETDHLAASVLRSLARSFRDQFSLSAGQASINGLLTFGLLPLWRLSGQFRNYIVFERQQFWHVAEWLRVRRGGDDAIAMHDAIRKLKPGAFLNIGKFLGTFVFIATVFADLGNRFNLSRVIGETYRVNWLRYGVDEPIWCAWVIGLGFAFFMHLIQVALHRRRVERVVDRFNRVATREGVSPIDTPDFDFGLNTGWLLGPGLLVWLGGALWAIPMALAGASQRRYINRTATRVRAEMLDRVRTMIAQQRPAVAVPNYVIHGRRCDQPRCQAPLKAGSRYCSRCGLATTGTMSELASVVA